MHGVLQVWGSTRDGRLQVFNAETGAVISTVDVPDTTFIWCIASVGSYVWCGTETGTILLYHGRRKCVCVCVCARARTCPTVLACTNCHNIAAGNL